MFGPDPKRQKALKGPKRMKKVKNGANLKIKNDRAVLTKPKVIVYISRSKKMLKLTPVSKIAPKAQKGRKRLQMEPNQKHKKIGL